MHEFLFRNARLKLLSFLLAVLTWGYLRFVDNPLLPNASARKLTVPISISGLRSGETVQLDEQNAIVTMAEPYDPLSAGDHLRVIANLHAYGPGKHLVPLQVSVEALRVNILEPANIDVTISEGRQP